MSLLDTGTYTITSGQMTHRPDAEPLLQHGDRVVISGTAGDPRGLKVHVEGSGRIAGSGISFGAFSNRDHTHLAISHKDGIHGSFLIAIRELDPDAQGPRMQLLAYHHPGGDDSGGEWNGHG